MCEDARVIDSVASGLLGLLLLLFQRHSACRLTGGTGFNSVCALMTRGLFEVDTQHKDSVWLSEMLR